MVATAVLGVLLVRRASGAAMVVGSSAVADVRAVPARVTDHDFSRSDRAARTENLNGERGVGIRPHPKCGIPHNPTPRWAFVACGVVARRQVAPPRRTVRVVLPPGGELLPEERNSVVIGRAVVPAFLKRAVPAKTTPAGRSTSASGECGPGWSSTVGVGWGVGAVGVGGGGAGMCRVHAAMAATASNHVIVWLT